jgi:hypothetical protein
LHQAAAAGAVSRRWLYRRLADGSLTPHRAPNPHGRPYRLVDLAKVMRLLPEKGRWWERSTVVPIAPTITPEPVMVTEVPLVSELGVGWYVETLDGEELAGPMSRPEALEYVIERDWRAMATEVR